MATTTKAPMSIVAARNGRDALQGSHVAGMQRRRLLAATTELAYEGGVQALSVATLCARAGLSRRTFYDLFEDRDACVHAAFEDAVETATRTVAQAAAGRTRWRERVRAGLSALLALLDREPGLARLLVVEALGCGPRTLELRRVALAQAAAAIDAGRGEARAGRSRLQAGGPPPLTAEGVVGAVFAVIHARLLDHAHAAQDGDARPLSELTGPLMALIVHPYLGAAASRRELEAANETEPSPARHLPVDPFKDLPIRLTYRTALVLSSIARSPGASNRQVGEASGIIDPGQISRLLTRLHRNGLIEDSGVGPTKGMARAWSLTERGEGVVQATGQV
jgi:AcrR family transcriptional regulator